MPDLNTKTHQLNRNAAAVVSVGYLGVGVIYSLVLVLHLLAPAPWDGPVVVVTTAVVAVVAWLGWLWLHNYPATPQVAHPALFALGSAMAMQVGFVIYLINNPAHTANQILLALSAALIFSRRSWFYSLLVIIVACWLPAAISGLSSADWQLWSRLLLTGCTLSITIFEARLLSVLRIDTLRLEAVDALAVAEVANKKRLSMERMMHAAQRRESLGVLAGGIAHDFNNLLTVIRGNTELAVREARDNASMIALLGEIDAASQRASELTQQMLVHAGRSKPKQERINLVQRLRDTVRLCESSLSIGATLVLQGDDSDPILNADGTLLDQVTLNLIQNASDALGETGGRISVRWGTTTLHEADIERAHFSHPPQPGEFTYFEVADTGSGMDEATIGRIFEPFFTTKSTGSGLGLSAVMGILDSHQAGICVTSVPGEGTTIRVLLPQGRKLADAAAL